MKISCYIIISYIDDKLFMKRKGDIHYEER